MLFSLSPFSSHTPFFSLFFSLSLLKKEDEALLNFSLLSHATVIEKNKKERKEEEEKEEWEGGFEVDVGGKEERKRREEFV